jgi:hypothetical protein
MQEFGMERFNFKKLNNVKVKEQYHVYISNRFAALKGLDGNVDISRAWDSIRENVKTAKETLWVVMS